MAASYRREVLYTQNGISHKILLNIRDILSTACKVMYQEKSKGGIRNDGIFNGTSIELLQKHGCDMAQAADNTEQY